MKHISRAKKSLIAFALAIGFLSPASGFSVIADEVATVTCSSQSGGYHACSILTENDDGYSYNPNIASPDVDTFRLLVSPDDSCGAGTYGISGWKIWVAKGCSGTFQVVLRANIRSPW